MARTKNDSYKGAMSSKGQGAQSGADLKETSFLTPYPYPELVFGLVGPIGVSLDPVISVLKSKLRTLEYSSDVVRLSECIERFFSSDYSSEPEHKRIKYLMDEGTKLRVESERGDAVALLTIAEIANSRASNSKKNSRRAFILRSLKHPHEVETLRTVYGKGFFLISVYSPRDVRVAALSERISKSQFGKANNARAKAERLVERDEVEENIALGQDVKDAFPMADLFIDGRDRASFENQINRFIELLFGNVFLTPTRDEHGMYHARSAALRSSDLNRQVGAAILRSEGDLIAVGCNDVPKAGGDLYWTGDKGDARDFLRGIDSMADERVQVLGELLERLKKGGLLNVDNKSADFSKLVHDLISGNQKFVLKGSRVMNLLEFGRSVHAEMAGLMTAARLGISVQGATLYCTTFPCHMCARHIVASGVKRVVYIEPYPKSKAKQLHQDAIVVDPVTSSESHVNFEPFEGVAPRQYQEIFDPRDTRKDPQGKTFDWQANASPRFLRFATVYREVETAIIANEIPRLAKKLGVKLS